MINKEQVEVENLNNENTEELVDSIELKTDSIQSVEDYLDADILNIKSYTSEELDKIKNEEIKDTKFDSEVYVTNFSDVNEKQVTKGTVVSINDKGILVDIGFKSEGLIPRSEFADLPDIGDEIDTFIVCFEDKRGRLILSKERADFEKRWTELRTAFSDEKVIKGVVTKRIKGGMVVDLGVVNAFLPGSQIDVKSVTNFDDFVGNEYEFKIVKFNEFRQNIVVSRKATLSTLTEENQNLLENLKVGEVVEGVVKNITDFGAFIDLGGFDGLLHITDITWGRINHPNEKLKLGDNINVKIIDYDKEKNRISLGLKQLTPDPWTSSLEKYSVKSIVNGKIVNIMNYGIFLELEEGIEGLIHISEISWTKHIKHPADIYKVGDKLESIVLSINPDEKKISLGVKQLLDNPWDSISEKFKVDEIYEGKVTKVIQNGVYVELDDSIEGFLHNNDMSWTRKIKSADSLFKENDKIKSKVIDVSIDSRKINLGLKQLTDNPWLDIDSFIKEGDEFDGKIIHIFDKGLIILLSNDFEGIVPNSNIDNIDVFNVDDSLKLSIAKIDVDNKKIILMPLISNDDESTPNDKVEENTNPEEAEEEK
tara:strand:- start:982 stop:2766 length:1785 start_codon:yes stop_codon:yes gene_type:complete